MIWYIAFYIEPSIDGFNVKNAKLFFGEPGENPGRTRRCKWERKPNEVTVLLKDKDETAWEDSVIRMIH